MQVKVELIVNGQSVQSQDIEADGKWNELKWSVELKESSWVALRIFPSLHTNPIFVTVVTSRFGPASEVQNGVAMLWMFVGKESFHRFGQRSRRRQR